MRKPDIPLFKTDLSGVNPDNKITREYHERPKSDRNTIFICNHGPFILESLVLYDEKLNELTIGKDYEVKGICSKATEYFKNKTIALFINLKNTDINKWYVTYQVPGNFGVLTKEMLQLLEQGANDMRPVKYPNIRNKPLWFDPEVHVQDLAYDFFLFADMLKIMGKIKELKLNTQSGDYLMMESFYTTIFHYINYFETKIKELIKSHVSGKNNEHGLTADQVGLGLVDNYFTANLQQTLEGLRDDLHITPFNAVKVIETKSGGNDSLLKSGTLPILNYGGIGDKPVNVTTSGFKIYFNEEKRVTLSGKNYIIKKGFLDLYSVTDTPINRTFYLYLTFLPDGKPGYNISIIPIAETSNNALLGLIKTNTTGITHINVENVTTFNGFRVSETRAGAVIPSASGSINAKGKLYNWANESDLI